MIHSVFVVNVIGDVILEKHFRTIIPRTVLDPFQHELLSAATPDDVAVCIRSSRYYLVSIIRNRIFFVAVISSEVNALLITEILHRIADIFQDYFGTFSEKTLLSEMVTAYQVLEEMLDNGFPLATEPNILKEMIRPPSWAKIVDQAREVVGQKKVKESMPQGSLTNTQWRRANVKYTQNEVFLDLVEYIDATIDRNGLPILCEIKGKILCRCHLSGVPDLTLSFMNPKLMDDVSFHPCVRLNRWSAERVLSFIPPDGDFELISYIVGASNQVPMPIYTKSNISFHAVGGCRYELEIGPKQTMGKIIEDLVVTTTFPPQVTSVSVVPSYGAWSFDQITRSLKWEIKRLPSDRSSTIRGSIHIQSSEDLPDIAPVVQVNFKIMHMAASGLKVNRLDMFNEIYKPFKGIKYMTFAGNFEVRP